MKKTLIIAVVMGSAVCMKAGIVPPGVLRAGAVVRADGLLPVIGVPEACAQENTTVDFDEATARRKARAEEMKSYFDSGYVGEKLDGSLQVMNDTPEDVRDKVTSAVDDENNDRAVVYNVTAEKNKFPLDQTQLLFYTDYYQRAKAGYWFETKEKDGSIVWKKK